MELRVIGCHGGETPNHRTTAFVVDERLALDAGSLTSGLSLKGQFALEACLVSHAHLDHVRDLATIADNRCQAECPPLVIASNATTIKALKKHFFNVEIKPEKPLLVAGYTVTAVDVDHTIDTTGFIVERKGEALGFSGDTGPTDRLWKMLSKQKNLKALLMEVSFPNREQKLATVSGHHTPQTLIKDLKKLRNEDLPTLLYHIKPAFQREVELECAKLKGANLTVCALGDHFVL
jgi:3',5'-cyclic-nucleotide phosphodiesterase